MQRKTFKALGTPTVQADALSDERIELTAEQILAAARKKPLELETQGEIDFVCDRQLDAKDVTLNDSLVGVGLEVRWRYRHKDTGEPIYIWVTGEVVQACIPCPCTWGNITEIHQLCTPFRSLMVSLIG